MIIGIHAGRQKGIASALVRRVSIISATGGAFVPAGLKAIATAVGRRNWRTQRVSFARGPELSNSIARNRPGRSMRGRPARPPA
jgi:hypothetical protein